MFANTGDSSTLQEKVENQFAPIARYIAEGKIDTDAANVPEIDRDAYIEALENDYKEQKADILRQWHAIQDYRPEILKIFSSANLLLAGAWAFFFKQRPIGPVNLGIEDWIILAIILILDLIVLVYFTLAFGTQKHTIPSFSNLAFLRDHPNKPDKVPASATASIHRLAVLTTKWTVLHENHHAIESQAKLMGMGASFVPYILILVVGLILKISLI